MSSAHKIHIQNAYFNVASAAIPDLSQITKAVASNSVYSKAPEGTVIDPDTGLMWTKATVATDKNWSDAKKAAASVRLGGFSDWRLPTIKELLTLVDYDRYSPAINTDLFECESGYYWSSTPYASSPSGCALLVNFGNGIAGYDLQYYEARVRAVRSVSSSSQ